MTRTPEQILCCPDGCEYRNCSAGVFGSIVARLHAAGYMIVPREATKAMVLAAIARPDDGASEEGLFYHAIYRAMTDAGELK
ncbi:MAG: hypothetical protein Q7U75_12700 [Desulfobacterales bacterium]|nr:hypothetical protein [Desulfobacterales bacterium]